MKETRQTAHTETVAFRVPEARKHLYRAAAARRRVFLSDWLRGAAESALAEQMPSVLAGRRGRRGRPRTGSKSRPTILARAYDLFG